MGGSRPPTPTPPPPHVPFYPPPRGFIQHGVRPFGVRAPSTVVGVATRLAVFFLSKARFPQNLCSPSQIFDLPLLSTASCSPPCFYLSAGGGAPDPASVTRHPWGVCSGGALVPGKHRA